MTGSGTTRPTTRASTSTPSQEAGTCSQVGLVDDVDRHHVAAVAAADADAAHPGQRAQLGAQPFLGGPGRAAVGHGVLLGDGRVRPSRHCDPGAPAAAAVRLGGARQPAPSSTTPSASRTAEMSLQKVSPVPSGPPRSLPAYSRPTAAPPPASRTREPLSPPRENGPAGAGHLDLAVEAQQPDLVAVVHDDVVHLDRRHPAGGEPGRATELLDELVAVELGRRGRGAARRRPRPPRRGGPAPRRRCWPRPPPAAPSSRGDRPGRRPCRRPRVRAAARCRRARPARTGR